MLTPASALLSDASDEFVSEVQAIDGASVNLADAIHFGSGGSGAPPAGLRAVVRSSHESLGREAFGEAAVRVDDAQTPVLMRDVATGQIATQHLRHYHDWRFRNGWRVNTVSLSQLSNVGFTVQRFSDTNHLRLVNPFAGTVLDLGGTVMVLRDDEYVDIWRRTGSGVHVTGATADVYLEALDQSLENAQSAGGGALASRIRVLYGTPYGYGGPTTFKPHPFHNHDPASIHHNSGF